MHRGDVDIEITVEVADRHGHNRIVGGRKVTELGYGKEGEIAPIDPQRQTCFFGTNDQIQVPVGVDIGGLHGKDFAKHFQAGFTG